MRANGDDMSRTKLVVFQLEFRLGNAMKMPCRNVEANIRPRSLGPQHSSSSVWAWRLANAEDARIVGYSSGAKHRPWPGVYQIRAQSRDQSGGP
jgi:hypothetical protein